MIYRYHLFSFSPNHSICLSLKSGLCDITKGTDKAPGLAANCDVRDFYVIYATQSH